MNNIKHTLWEGITNLSGKISGPMKESKFYTEGKLTPDEYILAGDFLTQKCPTWKWCEASEGHYDKRLPKEKQYLKTTVACNKRAQDYMKLNATTEKEVEGDWIEADLVKTDESGNVVKCEQKVLDLDDDDEKKEKKNEEKEEKVEEEKEEEDDDDDDDGDEIVIKNKPKKETKQAEVKENDKKTEKKKNENYRTYDVTVTYDFYYCVPRMWLMGYNSNGQPLSEKEMKEDVMEEYRNKTVTFEQHPGTGLRYVSVHPCRHSLLLKKMIQNFENSGKKLEIHMSILIFLKFLHSVVPTIQYDFTMDINF